VDVTTTERTPTESAATQPSQPLFRSSELSDTDSDSEEEPNINKANETWARLKLKLDTLRTVPDVNKKKKRPVVLETPEMRRLVEQIAKVEKDYLFTRKDAGMSPSIGRADGRCHIQIATG
jgi:ATP-dependent RNA helicase DHX29